MHLYMRTSKIPHLREAAFPFAEVTGTKSQDEGGNGAAPGPRPGLRVFSWLSHLPILRGQPEGCFQNTGLTYPFQAERWPLALHHPRDHGFFFFRRVLSSLWPDLGVLRSTACSWLCSIGTDPLASILLPASVPLLIYCPSNKHLLSTFCISTWHRSR